MIYKDYIIKGLRRTLTLLLFLTTFSMPSLYAMESSKIPNESQYEEEEPYLIGESDSKIISEKTDSFFQLLKEKVGGYWGYYSPSEYMNSTEKVIDEELKNINEIFKDKTPAERRILLADFTFQLSEKLYNQTQELSLINAIQKDRYMRLIGFFLSMCNQINPHYIKINDKEKIATEMWNRVKYQLGYQKSTPNFVLEIKVNEENYLTQKSIETIIKDIFNFENVNIKIDVIPYTRKEIYDLGDPLESVLIEINNQNDLKNNQLINSSYSKDKKYKILSILKDEKNQIKAIVLTLNDESEPLNENAVIYIVFIKTHENVLEFSHGTGKQIFNATVSLTDSIPTWESIKNTTLGDIGTSAYNVCTNLLSVSKYTDRSIIERLDFSLKFLQNLDENHKGEIIFLGKGNAGGYVQSVVYRITQDLLLRKHQREKIKAHTFQSVGSALYECPSSFEGLEESPITNHIVTKWSEGWFVKQGKGKHIGKSIYYDIKENTNLKNTISGFFDGLINHQINPFAYNHLPTYFKNESPKKDEDVEKK